MRAQSAPLWVPGFVSYPEITNQTKLLISRGRPQHCTRCLQRRPGLLVALPALCPVQRRLKLLRLRAEDDGALGRGQARGQAWRLAGSCRAAGAQRHRGAEPVPDGKEELRVQLCEAEAVGRQRDGRDRVGGGAGAEVLDFADVEPADGGALEGKGERPVNEERGERRGSAGVDGGLPVAK